MITNISDAITKVVQYPFEVALGFFGRQEGRQLCHYMQENTPRELLVISVVFYQIISIPFISLLTAPPIQMGLYFASAVTLSCIIIIAAVSRVFATYQNTMQQAHTNTTKIT